MMSRIITDVDDVYSYALRLLKGRDYSVQALKQKLATKFGAAPPDLIELLLRKNFLNDRRLAENYVARRKHRGAATLHEELLSRGISPELAGEILSRQEWPSLHEALKAKMDDWNMRAPLQSRDAARLFRALLRLGYDEDAIREEIERLHAQQ